MPLLHALARTPRWLILTGSLALLIAIFAADVITGSDLSFVLFYLGPVALAAWFGGTRIGVAVSALTAFLWQAGEILTGQTYRTVITPYWNLAVRFAALFVVARLLSALRAALEHERQLARRDDLTGVHNSRAFRELASDELRRARRYGHPLTLAFLDLDDFKRVNDELGHSAGDTVLREAAQAMLGSLRGTDLVARLGGDEFAILLPRTDGPTAGAVLRKVHEAITVRAQAAGRSVTASLGAMTWDEAPDSVDELLRLGDEQMYRTKRTGKNRVEHQTWVPHRAAG